ncbi:PDR/VanB family oxidoreductase [[Mycobacterium] nativiensis]|uniref:PDR/VanB family oxidoreductase n=1 Tax=[Mycobacterium] nativiensis TaxID=2855503 RepID=A0ABU5XVM6_9MYCO|nr:PDR/VanB family oxidoreductase [Mycolicibacter sp. MYC340]MEB3031852.1 PDR/VanB family oxidoreductase [Mycolicibacter sp. MYC340]
MSPHPAPVLRAAVRAAGAYRNVFAEGTAAALLSRPKPVRRHGFDMTLTVAGMRRESEDVMGLQLARPAELPTWTPGAHLDVTLPSGLLRQYSLCGDPADRHRYRIAVRRIPGGGGSGEIHDTLRPGDFLRVRGPRNAFVLIPAASYLFVAGGIGITPILPMFRAAVAAGIPARLVYCGRSRATLPFLDELAAIGGEVSVRPDDEFGVPDVEQILADVQPGTAVYVCGPAPMADAARLHLPTSVSLFTERFSAPSVTGEKPFTATLQRSGIPVDVGPDESFLSAVRRVQPGVAYSCQQGFCGSCKMRVVDGAVDHRDHHLIDAERADSMLICVSRAAGDHLVLDA